MTTRTGTAGNDILVGGPSDDTLYGLGGDDTLDGGAGNDVLNPGDNERGRDLVYGSTGNDTIVYTGSGENAWQVLDYSRLGNGITVTIDANRATVDKGSAGTDTVVDINNALTGTGLELRGTSSNDVFDLEFAQSLWGWMQIIGGAGDDTFNISGDGIVRIDYRSADHGIDVDLQAGRANDDGHGNVDTFNGHVHQIRGSDFSDRIIGSDRGELFIGRQGNDTIDGGGGFDHLRFYRSSQDIRNLDVDLEAGTATGTWNDSAFSYRISNIERVSGNHADDTLRGSAGDDRIEGRAGNDILDGRTGDDTLTGGAGNDIFIIGPGHGHVTITDFTSGEDRLDFTGFGEFAPSWTLIQLLAELEGENTNLALLDDAAIELQGVTPSDLDATNFVGLADPVSFSAPFSEGTEGNDSLSGGADNDGLLGEDGNDLLTGGGGRDWLGGGGGHDRLLGGADGDTLDGGEGDDRLWGQADNDLISGGDGLDILSGGEGNDLITTGAGADIVLAGLGDDTLIGGAGNNRMWGEAGNDLIRGGSDGENFLAAGTGNDTLEGGKGAGDYLDGEEGNDRLDGGAGHDALAGGEGNDTLLGGIEGDTFFGQDDADTFIYNGGTVWVMDYEPGVDTLDFNGATVTGTRQPGDGAHLGLDMSDSGTIWLAWTTLDELPDGL